LNRLISVVVLIGIAATACRSSSSTDARSTPNQSESGQTLRIAITDPESINPTKASSRWGTFVVKQICDPLVGSDPRTGALKPGIAESWTISEDAKKITFKIRQGAKFQNGREVTAEDYVWSLSRFVDPTNGSSQHFLLDKVAGYSEVRSAKAASLAGVKALDPHVLEISLVEPNAELPAVLANPSVGAVIPKEEAGASDSYASKPVCTGPYEVASPWIKGQDIHLSRFKDYYRGDASISRRGTGNFTNLVLKVATDEKAAAKLLDQGQVDIAPVPLEYLSGTRLVTDRVSAGPSGYFAYIGLPVTHPPFDNPDVRRALSASTDRRAIIKALFAGSRISASGFLPPSAGPSSSGGACPDAARTAGSGAPLAGKTMPVYLNSGGGHEKWLQKVADQWKGALDVQSELKPLEWPNYLDYLATPGPDGPFRLAWTVKYPSPEAVLQPLFESSSLDNFTRFSNAGFDGLLKKARSTVNDAERLQVYAAAAQVLCDQVPIIPMWFGQNQLAFAHGLRASGPRPLQRVDVYGDPILQDLSAN